MGTKTYKTLNIYPEDYERLQKLANGMPLGKTVSMILDTLDRRGIMVIGISELPCPEGAHAVPLVTVDARSIDHD